MLNILQIELALNKLLLYYKMLKGRNENNSVWVNSKQTPIYLDSAFKQLRRQEHKAVALKNRTKVLELNQDHIMRQIENNSQKVNHIEMVKEIHEQGAKKLIKERQKKLKQTEELKNYNQNRRLSHQRLMSTINLQKNAERDRIREEAIKNRKQNIRLIEANRQTELQKKKQVRNKIHNDIMESRSTIKNFFIQKHQSIIEQTQQQIKKLNKKRIKEELASLSESGKVVSQMEEQIKQMKSNLKASRVGFELEERNSYSRVKKSELEQKHPLVKKIESVMNRYTKFL